MYLYAGQYYMLTVYAFTWLSTRAHPSSRGDQELSDESLRRYDLHPPAAEKAEMTLREALKAAWLFAVR